VPDRCRTGISPNIATGVVCRDGVHGQPRAHRRDTGRPAEVVLGVYSWEPGDPITLGAGRSLRVVDVRDQDEDEPVVLVVEDNDRMSCR
jgi:hypothetical protein